MGVLRPPNLYYNRSLEDDAADTWSCSRNRCIRPRWPPGGDRRTPLFLVRMGVVNAYVPRSDIFVIPALRESARCAIIATGRLASVYPSNGLLFLVGRIPVSRTERSSASFWVGLKRYKHRPVSRRLNDVTSS